MKTQDELYDEFFKWLDKTYPNFKTPAIGNVQVITFTYSDIMTTDDLGGICDEVFDEWLRLNYPKEYKRDVL